MIYNAKFDSYNQLQTVNVIFMVRVIILAEI